MTEISAHIQLSGRREAPGGKNPIKKFTLCGGNGLRVPPVPIPNTEVKPQHADGTWLETARESRSLPHSIFPDQLLLVGVFVWEIPADY